MWNVVALVFICEQDALTHLTLVGPVEKWNCLNENQHLSCDEKYIWHMAQQPLIVSSANLHSSVLFFHHKKYLNSDCYRVIQKCEAIQIYFAFRSSIAFTNS